MVSPPVVLASASPRRAELLRKVGVEPAVIPVSVDETPLKGETPCAFARRMSAEKMKAALLSAPAGAFVLTGDTVVALGRRVVDKAAGAEDVRAALNLLSGRGHRIYTAVSCYSPFVAKAACRVSETRVTFKRLSAEEIDRYVAGGEGVGKAGGYALQGSAEAFVERLCGSYSGALGLPMCDTLKLLVGGGFRL